MDEFQSLLLSELKDLKQDMKAVREQDIPNVRSDMAAFKATYNGKIKSLEKSQKWYSGIYTVIGGAIAVLLAKYTGGGK